MFSSSVICSLVFIHPASSLRNHKNHPFPPRSYHLKKRYEILLKKGTIPWKIIWCSTLVVWNFSELKLMSSYTAKSSSIFYTLKSCCLLLCPVSQHVAPPVPLWCPFSSVALLACPLLAVALAPLPSDAAPMHSERTTESCQGRFSLGVHCSVCPHTG